ncbi:MAG TPA: amino acid adenylation domain-containing protein [Longimicrobium sp.]
MQDSPAAVPTPAAPGAHPSPESGTDPRARTLHALFARQAQRTPGAVAVEHGGERLTYAQLDARAGRLAGHLRALGVEAEARVAICVERGVEMVVGMLGVMKAGGAYVPLDPAYPAERLAFMLRDCGASVLLTQAGLEASLPAHGARVVRLDADAGWGAGDADPAPEDGATGESLAYVIYTSGSTGTPKGVMVPHGGVPNLLDDVQARAPLGPGDRCSVWTSISFDVSVYEVFAPLLAGATLCVPPGEVARDGAAFMEWLADERIGGAYVPPFFLAEYREWLRAHPGRSAMRRLLVGVEPISEPLLAEIRRRVPGLRVINGYGPTETTICATLYDVPEQADRERPAPIGRAVANTRLYVLDEARAPVADGEPGELYVGGAGLARGYLGRPELTAERFVDDPFRAGERVYRTGDRVRMTADGDLEFVGRVDHQVKIRGFRIEPGEIESVLAHHPGVREAVVVAREDVPGDRRLVAYVSADGGVDADALRGRVKERLPEHMVPAAFVVLDRLPLSPNGKVDRRALPAPAWGAASDDYQPPRTRVEQAVARVWAGVLGVERVGVHDDFFALGGHSLSATQAMSRVRRELGVELPLRALADHPTLAAFAAVAEGAAAGGGAPELGSRPRPRTGDIPLSSAQESVWFFQELSPELISYHFQGTFRLSGRLDTGALERALTEIVRRHEIFYTTFVRGADGPVQRIGAPWAVSLGETDLRALPAAEREAALQERLRAEFHQPFDLSRLPLIRWSLYRTADDEWTLAQVEHHFVHDGWSYGLLVHEMVELYQAFAVGRDPVLPALDIQFADYALWQREWLRSDAARRQLDFWTRSLAGAPPVLELPTDHPRPPVMRFHGRSKRIPLRPDLAVRAQELSRREGVSFFTTLFTVFSALLHRYTGQDDFVVGSSVANRGQQAAEKLIGMFVNMLALRVRMPDGVTFRDALAASRDLVLDAQSNQELPFERVVEALQPERSLSHLPVYQVAFNFHHAAMPELELPGLSIQATEGHSNGSAKFDIAVVVIPRAEQRRGADAGDVTMVWEYNTDLYDEDTIDRMVEQFQVLLQGALDRPDAPVAALPVLLDEERRRVLDAWNDTAAPRAAETVHGIVRGHARLTPHATAVEHAGERLTYAQLDAHANRLAHHLRALGVRDEARVGLCVEPGIEMVVGMLGVMKAGGAYVPLDPAYPADRLAFMLEDCGASVLLTQARLEASLPACGARVVRLDADGDGDAIARQPAEAPEDAATPESLAYVIYTSGSTGTPKGVMVPHRGVPNLLESLQGHARLGEGDRCSVWTSISFDASVLEIFTPLLCGAALCVPPREVARECGPFLDWLAEARISGAYVPPFFLAEYRDWLHAHPGRSSMRRLAVGVEPISEPLLSEIRRAVPGLRVLNGYGPTEATICCTIYDVPEQPAAERRAPIGRPVENMRMYVLDAHRALVPTGAAGELYIGGAGLARGYLGRPELTAERFVDDPFRAGERVYRTGDRVRWLADGNLEFVGRVDHQVKIRGFRVEPGEIESVLAHHPGVRDAVVVAREDVPGDRRLVAYVAADDSLDEVALRDRLRRRLPEHMVPQAVVRLDALPLSPNGKVDRRALPAPAWGADEGAYVAPRTAVEEVLAGIWCEVLGLERVGVHDDFFRLGGHSLLATKVSMWTEAVLGVRAPVQTLFENPTVAGLAAVLEPAAGAAGESLVGALGAAG